MKLILKKKTISLVAFLAIFTFVLLMHILANGMTDDLRWYINKDRLNQGGYIGIDKSRVTFIIDLFETETIRLLSACCLTASSVALSIFTTNETYKSQFRFWFMLISLVIFNFYLIQLSVHLWRQSIALFLFFTFLNVFNPSYRILLLFFTAYFHEVFFLIAVVSIPLSMYRNYSTIIFYPVVILSIVIVDPRLVLCLVSILINKEYGQIYYRYLAATNILLLGNIAIPYMTHGSMYDVISDRVLILTLMFAVGSICLTLLRGYGFERKTHYTIGIVSFCASTTYGILSVY